MPIDRDDKEERAARIDALLEEARTRSEALTERNKRIKEAARKMRRLAKAGLDAVRSHRPSKKSASGR